MARELFCQAVLKFVLGLVLVNILIFFPAGTFYYWHAWLFIGILFIPMFFAGIVMMFKNPELLKKRLNAKEQQTEQDLVVKLSGLMFVLGFVIAGLNFRFKWITLPEWVSWLATVIFLFSYYFYILSRLFQVINLPYKFTLKNTESLSSCFIPRYLLVIS